MALHFVTASQNGVKHVQSYNDAHYNAGTLGNGCYILPVRDKLQASMPDSNTVRILGGDFVVCGRHVAIDGGYEEVNIDNGIPGYNRIDLVVARVETAPSEKAELKVYKGEETTGTPVVPGHVEGDLNDGDTVCEMPICSVRVNGINPQAPEMLAKESIDIMALLQELRDYKSQSISGIKLVDKSVTRAKLADEVFPLFATAEVSKQYTVAAGAVADVNFGNTPVKEGYTHVGMCNFSSGHVTCVVAGITGRYMSITNVSSSSVTATAKITHFYIRS